MPLPLYKLDRYRSANAENERGRRAPTPERLKLCARQGLAASPLNIAAVVEREGANAGRREFLRPYKNA